MKKDIYDLQGEAQETMRNAYGKEMKSNPYMKNETMRLLGKQCSSTLVFWWDDEIRREIRQISEARPYTFTLEAASDIFMLGYIHGKRAERKRKKEGRRKCKVHKLGALQCGKTLGSNCGRFRGVGRAACRRGG